MKARNLLRAFSVMVGLITVVGACWFFMRGRDEGYEETPPKQVEAPAFSPVVGAQSLPLPVWLGQRGVPKRRVAGRVTHNGQPVSGAVVAVEPVQPPVPPPQETRSDANGRFAFEHLPALPYNISAFAPGLTAALVAVDLRDPLGTPAPEDIELVLTSCEAELVGKVLDTAGGPISHARVQRVGALGVDTHQDGSFELCLPVGSSSVAVRAAGYGCVQLTIVVLAGRMERNVVLVPEAFVVGRVVMSDTETPVKGVRVLVFPVEQGSERVETASALSDARGRFRIATSPGEHRAAAFGDGAATIEPVLVTALAGLESEITLRMLTHPMVRGRVLSEGKPIAGANVIAWALTGRTRSGDAFSQNDGSFILDRILPGEFTFTALPWEVVAPASFRVSQAEELVTLEVRKMASIRGRITFEGSPVTGAQVFVATDRKPSSTVSDAAGRYEVRGLAPGKYRVFAQSEHPAAYTEGKQVSIRRGEDLSVDLELDGAASIAGSVYSEDGKPVAGVMVEYKQPSGDLGRSLTDAQGKFKCGQMTGGGKYEARVFPWPALRTAFEPVSGFQAIDLVNGKSHVDGQRLVIKFEVRSIAGKVLNRNGEPVADARVQALRAESGEAPLFHSWLELPSGISDPQGAFEINGLAKGSYSLRAQSPEGATAIQAGVASGTTGVIIHLEASGGINGSLVDFAEQPTVYARPTDLTTRIARAEVQGNSFHIRVAPGSYVVTAMSRREGDTKQVEVQEGKVAEVTLTSSGSAVVRGTVTQHGTNVPVAGLHCRSVSSVAGVAGVANWNSGAAATTDASGGFAIDPSPAGEVLVSCIGDSREYSQGSAVVTASRGGEVVVNLQVVRQTEGPRGDIGAILDPRTSRPTIVGVTAGLGAAMAGIAAGDVVVAIDGVDTGVLDSDGVGMLISNHSAGSSLSLTVVRGPSRATVTVAVGAARY